MIYFTGHGEYCTDVYETNHIYFLMKPLSAEKFALAMKKATDNIVSADTGCFVIKNKGGAVRLQCSRILYMESDKRKIVIHTDDGCYECYQTLAQAITQLPAAFISSHKSFLVNMNRVAAMNVSSFRLDSGDVVPISQGRATQTKAAFMHYIGEKL